MPNFDESTVQKYINVLKLVHGGSGHEKTAAAAAARKMESKYPGITAEVERRVREAEAKKKAEAQKTQAQTNQTWAPSGVWPKPGAPGPSPAPGPKQNGNWEQWFQFIGELYTGVSGAVRNAMYGAKLAQTVSATRNTRSGATYLSVRIPTATLMEVRNLDVAQRDVFRAEVLRALDEELLSLLE